MASFTLRAGLSVTRKLSSDTLALIVGKARHLKAVDFEKDLKTRFEDWVSAKLWSEAISTIPKSGSASIPLYLNLAKVNFLIFFPSVLIKETFWLFRSF